MKKKLSRNLKQFSHWDWAALSLFALLVVLMGVIFHRVYLEKKDIQLKNATIESLREKSSALLQFSEENYHTQLEVWEYAYQPTQERLSHVQTHRVEFLKRLDRIKKSFGDNLDEIKPIIEAVPKIEKSWDDVLLAISLRKPKTEIDRKVFLSEEIFDRSRFNAHVRDVTNQHNYQLKQLEREISAIQNDLTVVYQMMAALVISMILWFIYRNNLNVKIRQLKVALRSADQSKQEAQTAYRIRSEFIANMSHEIRTPMNGIIGMTDLLLSTTQDPVVSEKLRIVQNCGDSLLNIVNDVLDFSKLEANKVVLELVSFDPSQAINEVVELFSAKASQKGLVMSSSSGEPLPLSVRGDVTKFKQVLSNLVSNAIKFTSSGTIKIFSKAVLLPNGNWEISVSVKDSGIGISTDVQDHLFLPFSQVDASTTRRFGGSGLGLAVSKGLVEVMQGTIGAKSQKGFGSEFFFSVQMQPGEEISPKQTHNKFTTYANMSLHHPLRILIAEDNRVNQMVLCGILGKLGYTPDVVENGLQVLEKIKTVEYDLIFMDCHMPEMDGFEATRSIIGTGQPRPRIVATTASATQEDIKRCFDCGMDSFLAKPIAIHELVKILENIPVVQTA